MLKICTYPLVNLPSLLLCNLIPTKQLQLFLKLFLSCWNSQWLLVLRCCCCFFKLLLLEIKPSCCSWLRMDLLLL
ncbi:hypothetical protein OIU79_017455, partial [Salix purpurea]